MWFLMVLLWIPQLKSCPSILDHLKEDVIKIQQQNPYKRFANVRKDQEYIADFQVGLNALVSVYHICSPFFIISFFDYSAQLSGVSQC